MKKIVRYNWRFYASALAGMGAVAVIALLTPQPWRSILLWSAMPALWWVCSSLAVSYYIYDRSDLYSLRWLGGCFRGSPERWLNIHAGLDESSTQIAAMFPRAAGQTVDVWDGREMTESSIAEARRAASGASRAMRADWRSLPFADHAFDAAFLIFSAHELRRPEARAKLFCEVARALRAGGQLVLVEHLRNWANFLAFGPGFLHFHSERSWKCAAAAARLRVRKSASLTPFVHVFVLETAA